MRVRRAGAGDEEVVRAVRLEAVADSPGDLAGSGEDTWAPEDWRAWIERGATFLAEGDRGTIGLAACVPHADASRARYLEAMWVHPDARGTGAADALVAAIRDWAEGHGYRSLWLEVRESNSRARRFYERTGFRHTGDSVKRGGVAEVVMRLDLPPRVEVTAPREDLAEPFLEMAREWRESGEDAYAAALDDFEGYLSRLARHAEGRDLRPGRVPYLVFWLIGEDRRVLGTSRLRLGLTPGLEKEGGHIGYDVRPSERRKGYATALLARTLDEARARGIDDVLVTCDEDNVGSIRVIENNGGELLGQVVSDRSGKTVNRYRITEYGARHSSPGNCR
jgi:predicted acetyltransferase